MGRRKDRQAPKVANPQPVVAPPQPRRRQLIASIVLFGLWLIFLLTMAITA